jgi:hypothetical protein
MSRKRVEGQLKEAEDKASKKKSEVSLAYDQVARADALDYQSATRIRGAGGTQRRRQGCQSLDDVSGSLDMTTNFDALYSCILYSFRTHLPYKCSYKI